MSDDSQTLQTDESGRISRSLRAIADWMDRNGHETLDEEAKAAIDTLLSSHSKKSQLFMLAAAQKTIQSIVRWMDASEVLEERLLDPTLMAQMDPEDLRKTIDLLHKKITDGMDFVRELAAQPTIRADDEEKRTKTIRHNGEDILEDPVKRESMRRVMERISQRKIEDGTRNDPQ